MPSHETLQREHRPDQKLLAKAWEEISEEHWEAAIDIFRQWLREPNKTASPDLVAEVHAGLSLSFSRTGKAEAALEEARKGESAIDGQEIPLARAKLLSAKAFALYTLGRYHEARECGEDAYELLRTTDEHQEVAFIQKTLGRVNLYLGDLTKARQALEDAVYTYRRIGETKTAARLTLTLGVVYSLKARWKQAIDLWEGGLEQSMRENDQKYIALFSTNLGILSILTGEWEKAENYLRQSLSLCERHGTPEQIARAAIALGELCQLRRQWDEAEALYQRAYSIAVENECAREEAQSSEYLGSLHVDRGNYQEGIAWLRKAETKAHEMGPEGDISCQVYRWMAEAALGMGLEAEAIRQGRQSLEIAIRAELKVDEGTAHRVVGKALVLAGRPDEAREELRRSVNILDKIGANYEHARSLFEFGKLLHREFRKESEQAWQSFTHAREIFDRLGVQHWIAMTDLEIARFLLAQDEHDRSLRVLDAVRLSLEQSGNEEALTEEAVIREQVERELVGSCLSISQEYSLLESIGETSSDGLDGLLHILTDRVNAERGLVALGGNGTDLRVIGRYNLTSRQAEHILGMVGKTGMDYTTRSPIISTRVPSDGRFSRLGESSVASLMVVPFGIADDLKGFMYVDRSHESFSQHDLNFFALFANMMALRVAQIHRQELIQDNLHLRRQLEERSSFGNLVTQSSRMLEILMTIDKVKDSSVPVLLEGETGTGKELLARIIHFSGERREKRFVPVNCAALPDTLLESELFGHAKGAFTGANRDKPGLFEVADGGTFFLDEVAEMGPSSQLKLLRVLEQGEVTRLGETEPRQVDVRVISATNKDLQTEVAEGRFREDLYYRLNALRISLPPLRERKEDIPALAEYFLTSSCEKEGKCLRGLSPEVMRLLMDYSWPGNIRELQNEIRRVVALTEDGEVVRPVVLSPRLQSRDVEDLGFEKGKGLSELVAAFERRSIVRALEESGGVKTKAARLLGVPEGTLRGKMKKYNLD
jgi:transcriptional regulator with GAF, ATPase, and Fis domain/tetratricopeptide (TPR) repeat protein